jgi:anti-sigma B factor antagonist
LRDVQNDILSPLRSTRFFGDAKLRLDLRRSIEECSRTIVSKEPPLNVLEISVLKYGDVESIALNGAILLGPAVDNLRKKVENLAEHGVRRFVFDLTNVTRIDSSGIGLLVETLYSTKKDGGSLKLVNPSKQVLQTLRMCSLLALFEVFSEEKEAIASFEGS